MPPISEFSDHMRGCRVHYVLYPGRIRLKTEGLLAKREQYEQELRGVQSGYDRFVRYSREYWIHLVCSLLSLCGAIFLGVKFYQYIYEDDGFVLAFSVPGILLILFFVFAYHFFVTFTRRRLEMAIFFFAPGYPAFVLQRLSADVTEFDSFLETLKYEIERSNYTLGDRTDEFD